MSSLKPPPRWKQHWILGLALASVSIACACSVAFGATYNFYFNNTEQQGTTNSATPSLTVSGPEGKTVTSTGADSFNKSPGPAPSAIPEPASAGGATAAVEPKPNAIATPGEGSSHAEATEPSARREFARWKLGPTFGLLGGSRYDETGYLYLLNFTYAPYRDVSFNLYGGMYSLGEYQRGYPYSSGGYTSYTPGYSYTRSGAVGGLEAQITPLHLSFGRLNDLFDVGVLLGASTLGAAGDNWVSAHTGVRASVNIGDHWGLELTGRGNLGYRMADLGVTLRL